MTARKVRQMGKREVTKLLSAIGPALAGTGTYKAAQIRGMFFSYFAAEIFNKWYQASQVKSDGMPDEFGNTWKPITEHTKIYRTLSSAEKRRFGVTKKLKRGLLTEEEDKVWKRVFASNYHHLSYWVGQKEAKSRAAKIAWTVVKEMGARTKKSAFRGRDARILYATGRLIESLRPSRTGSGYYRPNSDQIAEFNGTKIVIGTKVKYARLVSKVRPLMPPQYKQWASEIAKKAITHIVQQTVENIR